VPTSPPHSSDEVERRFKALLKPLVSASDPRDQLAVLEAQPELLSDGFMFMLEQLLESFMREGDADSSKVLLDRRTLLTAYRAGGYAGFEAYEMSWRLSTLGHTQDPAERLRQLEEHPEVMDDKHLAYLRHNIMVSREAGDVGIARFFEELESLLQRCRLSGPRQVLMGR
jgi:hypothetical protein